MGTAGHDQSVCLIPCLNMQLKAALPEKGPFPLREREQTEAAVRRSEAISHG